MTGKIWCEKGKIFSKTKVSTHCDVSHVTWESRVPLSWSLLLCAPLILTASPSHPFWAVDKEKLFCSSRACCPSLGSSGKFVCATPVLSSSDLKKRRAARQFMKRWSQVRHTRLKNIARGTTDPGYWVHNSNHPQWQITFWLREIRGYKKNKKYYFLSFIKKYSQAKKRSKRADHVNNVDSTINMLLLLGCFELLTQYPGSVVPLAMFIFQFTSKVPTILLWPSASATCIYVIEYE